LAVQDSVQALKMPSKGMFARVYLVAEFALHMPGQATAEEAQVSFYCLPATLCWMARLTAAP
jgi:hypothetical protein